MNKKGEKKKMKAFSNKILATLIALILIIPIATTLVNLQTVNAHTPPWNKASWTYVAVTPSPIGVGQTALVVFWLDTLPQTASGQYGDRFTFTVKVTKPDNYH